MKSIICKWLCILNCTALICFYLACPNSLEAKNKTVKLTLQPSALSVPAMKYRLMTPSTELKPGNAANYYQRALISTSTINHIYTVFKKEISILQEDLKTVRDTKNDSLFESLSESQFFYELERASYCSHCDWEIPYKQFRYSTGLPDIQALRAAARIVASDVRWKIAHGNFEEAIISARKGIMLSHNLHQGTVGIISNLVGFSAFDHLSKQLLELMEQSNSPNLYWALTEIAHQQPQYHHAIELENTFLLQSVPSFLTMEDHIFSDQEANNLKKEFLKFIRSMEGDNKSENVLQTELTLWSLTIYPFSQKVLEERGYSKEKIESMPTIQVVLLGQYLKTYEFRDEFEKCYLLNLSEGLKLAKQIEKKQRSCLAPLPRSMFNLENHTGYVGGYMTHIANHQQKINMLRTIELIRAYSSHHQKLPASLNELDPLLLPNDPATDKPFSYKVDGDTATLESSPVRRNSGFSYELQLAK